MLRGPIASARESSFTDPSSLPVNTIKTIAGMTGSAVSNLTGIPFDKFRVLVAQDTKMTTGLGGHLGKTFATFSSSFTGGGARFVMKAMAAQLNLTVPSDLRRDYPFLCSFAVGMGFSPILNVPRMLQLGRISGGSYPEIVRNLFTTSAGLKSYAQNTMLFGPGEGLRMMMCFGLKDWLLPRVGGAVDPDTLSSVTGHATKMALIAGPTVALVETTAALVTETVSTIQAHLKSEAAKAVKEGKPAPTESFGEVLKQTVTPRYMSRCWISLFAKNCVANTPLFFVMFTADFYARQSVTRAAREADELGEEPQQ
jgi:hypothetical protein